MKSTMTSTVPNGGNFLSFSILKGLYITDVLAEDRSFSLVVYDWKEFPPDLKYYPYYGLSAFRQLDF